MSRSPPQSHQNGFLSLEPGLNRQEIFHLLRLFRIHVKITLILGIVYVISF